MNWLALAGVAVAGMIVSAAPARADGDREAGRKMSLEHCARCHVIGDFNPFGGIGSTPSFQLLAKRNDWLERFQTFYERRPHPVFVRVPGVPRWTKLPSQVKEFRVTLENLRDIIAFVETLTPRSVDIDP